MTDSGPPTRSAPDGFARAWRERGRVLSVAAPAVATLVATRADDPLLHWTRWCTLGGVLLLVGAGAGLETDRRLSRVAALLSVVALAAGSHERLSADPQLVLIFGCGLAALHAMYDRPWISPEVASHVVCPSRTARVALLVAAVTALVLALGPLDPWSLSYGGLTIAGALALTIRWIYRAPAPRWSIRAVLGALAAGVLGVGFTVRDVALTISGVAIALLLAAALVRRARDDDADSAWDRLLEHPARVVVVTFAALAAVGTLLLMLPACAAPGYAVAPLDAAFTAVSAVCVTGLIVLDTPTVFSGFGEAVLLILIQIGGLGIMTFYTVTLAALGRRLSLRHERALAGALNVTERHRMVWSVGRILTVSAITELVGAVALSLAFLRHHPPGEAIWKGLFTSVSAFCNAGFALQTQSLVPYQSDPVVLHVVAFLIVVGGLSPAAVAAVPSWVTRRRVPIQSSLILWTTAILLVGGALLYGLTEWSVSLGHLHWVDRLHNAWFQSVTLRTAGFNSVDLAVSLPATQALMIVFMFVGGSPGGTAGGAKTTTIAVLFLTVVATLRGHPDAVAFGRRLGRSSVYKAAAVVSVGITLALFAIIALEMTQNLDPEVALFEIVSALATVGLSIGGTSGLDEVGKVIVMVCMFAGRVGPLTLFLFLTERRQDAELVVYPEAEVEVG